MTGTHVAKIYAVDRFDRLNPNYANLTASAVITVDFVLGGTELYFANAPPPGLSVPARLTVAVTLHQFTGANGVGAYTYNLVEDGSGYFALNTVSGVLSLPSKSDMLAGTYDLRVAVSDIESNQATAVVRVNVVPNQVFVTGGRTASSSAKDVWSSLGFNSWKNEQAPGWDGRHGHQAVAHNGRLYVMGGRTYPLTRHNDVWSSADGITWRPETPAAQWSKREFFQAVSHQGQLYVISGRDLGLVSDVWSSADGITWERVMDGEDWALVRSHKAVSHNGRIYVMGGILASKTNAVWSSADGITWRQDTPAAQWSARESMQAVSHNGRIYIMGGDDVSNSKVDDVWSSRDGVTWRQETAAAPWAGRSAFGAVSRGGRIYVMGGDIGSATQTNDVWSSADGKNWIKMNDPDWSVRYSHKAAVFPAPLALSGTSEVIILSEGTAETGIATVTAQNGFGAYTYSLESGSDFDIDNSIDNSSGVLSYNGTGSKEEYLVTVRVEDEDGSQAKTIIRVKIE